MIPAQKVFLAHGASAAQGGRNTKNAAPKDGVLNVVENRGIEPLTSGLQSPRSPS